MIRSFLCSYSNNKYRIAAARSKKNIDGEKENDGKLQFIYLSVYTSVETY